MKTLTKTEAFAMRPDELREMGKAILTRDADVVILETDAEVAAQFPDPPKAPDPIADMDEQMFRRRMIRELATRFGVTPAALRAALIAP
jgi:hypothetical protein